LRKLFFGNFKALINLKVRLILDFHPRSLKYIIGNIGDNQKQFRGQCSVREIN